MNDQIFQTLAEWFLAKAVWPNDSRSGVVHGRVCDLGPVEKAQALMPRWRVDIIRKRAEHLGTVEAPNASEAILEAIKRFEIPPERQNRITVEKMTENKDFARMFCRAELPAHWQPPLYRRPTQYADVICG